MIIRGHDNIVATSINIYTLIVELMQKEKKVLHNVCTLKQFDTVIFALTFYFKQKVHLFINFLIGSKNNTCHFYAFARYAQKKNF